MNIVIDKNSGFCFGVVYAIEMAEEILQKDQHLYCLGDIVHNNKEVDRLTNLGLEIIDHNKFIELRDCKVLIRAHGEPPETYKIALRNNIQLLDASCPVVLKLQHQIKEGFEHAQNIDGQVIVFGKEGHAEVKGLLGQTDGKAIVVASDEDLRKVDFNRPIYIYSQTTKSPKAYQDIINTIKQKMLEHNSGDLRFLINDTLCRQVSGREPELKEFARNNDVIVFVSGKKSSNGKMLFESCKAENNRSYFLSELKDLNSEWFIDAENIGICGATSTPRWLMENVSSELRRLIK